ncbi:MAG: hypothetical protein AABW92_00050 [Nanoarchaeota archaeon]
MKKLFESKKSKIFFTVLLGIFFIMALLPLAMNSSFKKEGKFDRPIGESQLLLLKTYEKGEKVLYYIDESAVHAFRQSIYNLSEAGFGATGCSEYGEYVLWNNEEKECYPNVKEALKQTFSQELSEYTKTYPDMPAVSYELFLVSAGEENSIVGRASSQLSLEITDNEKIIFGESIVAEEGVKQPAPDPVTQVPSQPSQPSTPVSSSPGKCSSLVDYAKNYIGCPYALNDIAGWNAPYNACYAHGLTCAGLTSAVVINTMGIVYTGHGRLKCDQPQVFKIGTDLGTLQPGDFFSAEYKRRDGSYTPWGHTGMYVGKGTVSGPKSYFGSRVCYQNYIPGNGGDYIFIHSIGASELGYPGVCYEPASQLFSGSIVLTNFCRLYQCA